MSDYIGKYVKRFESGDSGCLTFGQCGNDWGMSYGTNQRILRYGIAINFLKKYFGEYEIVQKLYFNNLGDREVSYWLGEQYCSSPDEVKAAWIFCVNAVGREEFERVEHEDILENYYDVTKKELDGFFDVEKNRAFQEMCFAGSIFNGAVAYANRIKNLLVSYQTDEQFFDLVYDSLYKEYKWERWAKAENCSYIGNSERETLRNLLNSKAIKEGGKMKKVMIDPGHFGSYYNQSPCDSRYYESNFTWDVSNRLKKYLESYGIQADLTRNNKDQDVGLVDRGKMSEGYDLFISMHSNAVGESSVNQKEEIDYPVSYCLVNDQRFQFDEVSREIGQRLATGVKEVLNTKQDGIIYLWTADWDRDGDGQLNDNYLGVLHGARLVGTPAVVLEHSFHTNSAATAKLLQESYVDALAKKDADVIADFLGVYQASTVTMTSFSLCDKTIRVIADSIAIYSDAAMTKQNGKLKVGSARRAVQAFGLSDNRKGLRLEDGNYINAIKGVDVFKNNMKESVKRAESPDGVLNVRDFPNSYGSAVLRVLANGNLVRVIGECYNNADHWYLVKIENSTENITGFAAARYLKNA